MDRGISNPPINVPVVDGCLPNATYTQIAQSSQKPCDAQMGPYTIGKYGSAVYGPSPVVNGLGSSDYSRPQPPPTVRGLGLANQDNFYPPQTQQPSVAVYVGNMHCVPQQSHGSTLNALSSQPVPIVSGPAHTEPMAHAGLTQNAASLGLQPCQNGASGTAAGGVDNAEYARSKAIADPAMYASVDEKARQTAELKIMNLMKEVVGHEFRKREKELRDNEKTNEDLFATYRVACAFKEGCLNSSVFQRKPLRNADSPDDALIEQIRRMNACGKELKPCTFKDKKETLLDSISETFQYLESYKKALDRNNATFSAVSQDQTASPMDTICMWYRKGLISTADLESLINSNRMTPNSNCH